MAEYIARPGDRIDQIVDTLYTLTDENVFRFLIANPQWDGQPIMLGGESFQAPPVLPTWNFAEADDPFYREEES